MKISIEHFRDQFNVGLSSREGVEPFLVIKGCRVVNGRNGEFVSWPSRKQEDGRYWNHVYASEAFARAVLDAYNESKPKPAKQPDKMGAVKARKLDDDDFSDPPF